MFTGMSMNAPAPQSVANGKGKGREIDFEAAFAQVAESLESQRPSARIEELDDTADLAAAMARTDLDAHDPIKEEDLMGTDFKT